MQALIRNQHRQFSSFSSYYYPWLYCVEFLETCDQVSFIPFLSGRRGAFSPASPPKKTSDRRFLHSLCSVTHEFHRRRWAWKSWTLQSWAWHTLNLKVPHSSFRLVKFFKNLNIPSRWNGIINKLKSIHRIQQWRTRGKKLVPSHESEALEDKQKLQMKTFSELAECLARIPPKITLYRLLFKHNYVGCLLVFMFSIDLLVEIKRDADRICSRNQDDFVGIQSIRSSTSRWWLEKSDKNVGPNFTLKPITKTSSLQFVKQKYKQILVARKKEISDGYMAYLLTQQTSAIEQNSSSRDGKKEDRKEAVTEVSMKLCLVFVCQDVILWSLSMKDIN